MNSTSDEDTENWGENVIPCLTTRRRKKQFIKSTFLEPIRAEIVGQPSSLKSKERGTSCLRKEGHRTVAECGREGG